MIELFVLLGLFSLRATSGNILWTHQLTSNPNTFVNITAHFGCEFYEALRPRLLTS